jgi:hypothetical protein
MSNVVAQGDGFGEVFIQSERPTDGARDLAHFEGMGEASSEVVAGGGNENLSLVFKPPECFGMEDSIAVTLERRSNGVRIFGSDPSSRI